MSATDARIRSVRCTPFAIPLVHDLSFSTGRLTQAEHLLVEVETDEGVVGFAEAIPRPMIYGETGPSISHIVATTISEAAVGLSLLDTQLLAERLKNLAGNPTARGAVELAMLDALGKAQGVSCHRLLGGFAESVVATVILGAGRVDDIRAEAAKLVDEHGITSFKIKVGMELEKDLRLVRALREDMPEALLYVDANHGYSASNAMAFLRRAAELDLAWIEEPCSVDDVLGRADVVARSPIPVMGDESCTTVREVVTEVLARRCTMVSIKLGRTGVAGSTRIREFCAAVGAPALLGSQGDSGIGTAISMAFAAADRATAWLPAELGYFLNLRDDLLTEPPVIRDGRMAMPTGPGFGTKIDPDKLARYRTANGGFW